MRSSPDRKKVVSSVIPVSFQLGGCEGKFKLPPKGPKVFVNVVSFTKLNARVSVLFKKDEFGHCLQPRDLGLQRLNAVGTGVMNSRVSLINCRQRPIPQTIRNQADPF